MNPEPSTLPPPSPDAPRSRWRWLLWLPVWLLLIPVIGWATLAIHYDCRIPFLRGPLTIIFPLAVVAFWFLVKGRLVALLLSLGAFALVLVWWLNIPASNAGDWQPDLAVLPTADISGNQVTIHNIRNCDYRTETDFDVRYYDKTFNLDELRTVDLYLVTWGSPHIAHTMASFGFSNGDHVCFSIETRKQKGQGYSAVKGMFRQFTLTYIVADERDLVRLRTNYRKDEQACLYHIRMGPEQMRHLFLDYLRRANELAAHPEWYNAVTDNCTTAIRTQRAANERQPWNWRMLINGHLDELLYERGIICTNLPFAELKKKSNINARAQAADKDPEFSKRIREGLPDL
jgi:hypothetical protein